MSEARTWIVTGGTGALGRAVATEALGRGARVVVPWIIDAERDALREAKTAEVESGALELVEADIADLSGAESVVRAAGEPAVPAPLDGRLLGGVDRGPPGHLTGSTRHGPHRVTTRRGG